jgi:hypothetical protein
MVDSVRSIASMVKYIVTPSQENTAACWKVNPDSSSAVVKA